MHEADVKTAFNLIKDPPQMTASAERVMKNGTTEVIASPPMIAGVSFEGLFSVNVKKTIIRVHILLSGKHT
jgi:hypothetical protein